MEYLWYFKVKDTKTVKIPDVSYQDYIHGPICENLAKQVGWTAK
jgi:hypothetical protein